MEIKEMEKVVDKICTKLEAVEDSYEAEAWARCLKEVVTANAINQDLNLRLKVKNED